MMIKHKVKIVILILQMIIWFCKGVTWNKNLTANETSLENDDLYAGNLVSEVSDNMKNKNQNEIKIQNNSFQSYDEDNEIDIEHSIIYNEMNFNTSEEIKPAIEDLKIVKTTAESLTISWKINYENPLIYFIEWLNMNSIAGNINQTFTDTTYTISNLDSCAEYKISVTPLGGTSEEVYGTTSKTQPGAPLILTADPITVQDKVSLNISWNIPKVGISCIKHYKVTLDANIYDKKYSTSVDVDGTNIIIKPLFACTSYLVTVQAIDLDDGEGLISTIQSKPTLEKVNSPPKLSSGDTIGIPSLGVTKTSIMMNWNVRDPTNNCSIRSVITHCNYSYSQGYGFKVVDFGASVYKIKDERNPPTVRQVVSQLSPFSVYFCQGYVVNVAGRSRQSTVPVIIQTSEDAPSAPEKFELLDNTNFIFNWESPSVMPGSLLKYEISIFGEPLYLVPDGCPYRRDFLYEIVADFNNYTWTRAEGFTKYSAYIRAQTKGGWSPESSEIHFDNQVQGVPDKVTNLTYVTKPLEDDTNSLETILSWNLPCSLKGELNHFIVSVNGTNNNNNKLEMFEVAIDVDPNFKKNDVISANLGELLPEFDYTFGIYAMVKNSLKKGKIAYYYTQYPAGIPPQPSEDYLKLITLNPDKITRTTTSFEILLPLFPNTYGVIQYYAIIISRMGYSYQNANSRWNVNDTIWPNISTWKESVEKDFTIPYQASVPYWTPYPNYIVNYGSIKAVKFLIGEDTTCNSLSTKTRLYCNGPLKPDTWYEVRMRAFTKGGYTDSSPFLVKTNSEVNVVLIISLVFGILLLGIIAAILLARISCYKRKKDNSSSEENSDIHDRHRCRRLTMNIRSYSHESSSINSAIRTRRNFMTPE